MAVSKCPCLTLTWVNVILDEKKLIGSYASTHSTFKIIGSCNRNPNTQRLKDANIQQEPHKWGYIGLPACVTICFRDMTWQESRAIDPDGY